MKEVDKPEDLLVKAAEELISSGWKKSELYKYLSENLSSQREAERMHSFDYRRVLMTLDMLQGLDEEELKSKYGRKSIVRKIDLGKGAKTISKILQKDVGDLDVSLEYQRFLFDREHTDYLKLGLNIRY